MSAIDHHERSLARARRRIHLLPCIRTRLMDVLYIRGYLAWIHAIVFGHVSEFQHIRVDKSGSCQNVYMELHNAPHRWHMKSGDR
jgi:hypothetical protein